MHSHRVLSVLAVTALALGPLRGQNLLQNPGFEEVGGNGQPIAWTFGAKAAAVADTALAHGGQRCGKGRFDDAISQRLPVQGGQCYRIRGWIRRVEPAGGEVPKIKVYFLTADGGQAGVQADEIPGVVATEWKAWESILRAPESAGLMNLTLRGFFGGSEFFYWDDLSVEAVSAPEWPAWEKVPALGGTTVLVPDLADVLTEAVLRWFSVALAPLDGRLDTEVVSRGQDVTVRLGREVPVNHVLIHTLKPLQNLRDIRVIGTGAGGEQELFRVGEQEAMVTSEQFPAIPLRELRLVMPRARAVLLSEIQAFGLEPGQRSLPGEVQRLGLRIGSVADSANTDAQAGALLLASAAAGTPGSATLLAGVPSRLECRLPTAEFALSGITLTLALKPAAPQTLIEVALMQAAELDLDLGEAELVDRAGGGPGRIPAGRREPRANASIFRVLSQVPASGALAVSFDLPDTVFGKGEPVVLTLKPQHEATLDLATSGVTLHVVPLAQALPEYGPRLERLLQRFHAQGTEAHAWGSYQTGYMGHYLRRVQELLPESQVAALVWSHVGGRRTNVALTRPGPAGAPEWAVWERLALANLHQVVLWWLDHRQRSDGQLGGHINDDGEFSCRWPTDHLITADTRIRDALQKLADVAWEMSGGKGYTVGSTDVEHAAEDQSCTQPQVLLTRYGSPKAMERLLTMSRYLDFWTALNSLGRRQFKSFMFNTERIWEEPPNDVDHAYCPLAMVGAGHAVWYADLPGLRRLFLEEAESWRLATASTDKGKAPGVVPHEVRFRDSEILPYAPYTKDNPTLKGRDSLYMGGAGQYIVVHLLQGASALTGDDRYATALRLAEPPDTETLKTAASLRELYNQEVRPPPTGPERRVAAQGLGATEVKPPLRPVRDGQALGALTAEGQAGEMTIVIQVLEPGRYALWARIGLCDAAATGPASFFADANGITDRLIATVGAGEWAPATGRQALDLEAGPLTIRLRPRTPGSAVLEVGVTSHFGLDGSWSPSEDETRLYQAWKLTGDKQWLIEELKEVVRQQERTRWLATEAEPFTDRVYWPGERLLANLYLGGTTAQKSHVPLNWLSWQGGGTEFAALVLTAGNEGLRALCYSFAAEPRELTLRPWRLPHGRYQVRIGIDDNGDDQPDSAIQERAMVLARYDAVTFTAQPGCVYVLDLELSEKLEDMTRRPDLGLDPWDVRVEGNAVLVTVHNIGGSPSPTTMVRIEDAGGTVLAEAALPAIDAPLDLQPRTATVKLALPDPLPPGARVTIDPDAAVSEITEANNTVPVGSAAH